MVDKLNFEEIRIAFQGIAETIYFDEKQYLREQTSAPANVKEFITQAEAMLQQISNLEEEYYLLGAIGYCYRVLNQAKDAIRYFEKCLKQVEKNPQRKMVTLIRLGEAYKCDHQHQKALELFEEAQNVRMNYRIQGYEDFINQHQAKCMVELGEIVLAKELLIKALKIRRNKGTQSLSESTEKVLHLIDELLKEINHG